MPSIWKNQSEQDKVQDHEDVIYLLLQITKLAEALDWNKVRCFMIYKDNVTGELKATLRYCYLDVDTHLEIPIPMGRA